MLRNQWATRASTGLGTRICSRVVSGPTRLTTASLMSVPSGLRIHVGWVSPGPSAYTSLLMLTLQKPRACRPSISMMSHSPPGSFVCLYMK